MGPFPKIPPNISVKFVLNNPLKCFILIEMVEPVAFGLDIDRIQFIFATFFDRSRDEIQPPRLPLTPTPPPACGCLSHSPFGSNWVGRVWAISLLSPNFCRNAKFIRFFLLLFLRLQSFVSFRERTARLFLAASCPIARALPLSLARPQACMTTTTTTTTTRHVAADDGFHKVREEMLFDGEMELNGLEGPKTTFSFPPVGCLIRPPSQRSRWTLYCCFFVAKWKWNKISSLFSTVCFRYWSFLLECATTNKMNFLATGVSSHRRRCCSCWHRFEVCRTRFRDDQFRFRTLARKNISRQKNHFSDWIFNFGCIWLIRCLG